MARAVNGRRMFISCMGCQYNVCLIYKRVINANIIACIIAVFLLYLYAVDNICVGSLLAVKCIYACYQMYVCLLSNELLLAIKRIFACIYRLKTKRLCAHAYSRLIESNLLYLDWMIIYVYYSTTTFLTEPSENLTMFKPFCGWLMRRPSTV